MGKNKKSTRATYALPDELFPNNKLILRWAQEGSWTPIEKYIRQLACEGYQYVALQDKELSRFIKPAIVWEPSAQKRQPLIKLGEHSWLASAAHAPFIPSECEEILAEFYKEPRSMAHLIGATFQDMRIMYLADSLDRELPALNGGCELLIILVKKGCKVRVTESSALKSEYKRSVIGIVEKEASMSFVRDMHAVEHSLLQHERWHLEEGAQLAMHEVLTGGRQSWLCKEFKLAEHAQVDYTWLAALRENEHAALTTVQQHSGPASKSSVTVKAALSERARSFYRGTIRIPEQGVRSEAHQQQKALMLSPEAKTCAIPSLEVETHEVQCAHGSAAGKFNADEVRYLRSKGLDIQQAEKLLIEGFFSEASEWLPGSLTRLKERCCL